jgi:hypothetical protein
MEAAQAAFRSALENCSNVLKKISTTFQNLDERQQRLEGNETVQLIVPILTNIEMQLSQYDIFAAADDVSAGQAARIAALEAELTTAKQQLSISRELAEMLTINNGRLNIELAKARESLAQHPSAMLLAAQMTPSLRPPASSDTYFSAGQFPPTPTSASTDVETFVRTKRQLTSPSKARDQPKRVRPNGSISASFGTAPDDDQQEDTLHPADEYDAKVMAQKIYEKFDFEGPWTTTDRELFLAQLESAYTWEKSFQKRIEAIDRHCTGIMTAEPPEPRPCFFAEITGSSPKGPGGLNMTWQNCKYCNGSPQRRCVSAKFAPHVPSPFGPRDSTGKVPCGGARRYNPVEPSGHFKRWIVTLRISDPQSELIDCITLAAT